MFGPLRTLGVPEPVIDVVEPFFRVIVELGYDRSIPPWQPTPARLIPTLDPAKVATDLVNAIGEGINNALALFGLPPLLSIPAPVTLFSTRPPETAKADMFRQTTSSHTNQAGDGRREPTAVESQHRSTAPALFRPATDPQTRPAPNPTGDRRRDGDRNPAVDVDRHGDRTHAGVVRASRCFRVAHHGNAQAFG